MQSFRNHCALLVILIPLFLVAKQSFPFTALVIVSFFWMLRTKDRSWILMMSICLMFLMPVYRKDIPEISEGRVATVKQNYVIVKKDRYKVILYTNAKPVLDSYISFSPDYHEIESSPGFYRFDFAGYCQRQGIYYASSIDSFHVLKNTRSLRGRIMQSIQKIKEEGSRKYCLEILLGIRQEENDLNSFLKDSGFSIAGVLILINCLLKYFMTEKKKNPIMLAITGFFCVLTHCTYLPLLRFLIFLLGKTKISGREKTCFAIVLSLFFHPEAVLSSSFLLPAVFRLVPLFTTKSKTISFTLSMCLQSILFQAVNPVQMLLYRFCIVCSGILWILAFFRLLFSFSIESIVQGIDHILSFLNPFTINGSMIGPGLIFFLLMLVTFRKSKQFSFWFLILFLLFDLTGMFHPFAEVVFINVGQGDSIYVQEPCRFHTALIDTGKPSAWNSVNTMLKAHGVKKMDTLIVTHGDNDHSGNQQNVIDTYSPKQVITKHQDMISCGRLQFYDLNDLSNENENQSSIVALLQLNQMKILFMADADSFSEKRIIRKYGNLHADILKLSHHGSKTGSSEDFLNHIKPSLGIISCGNYSIYHHPSPETMQRLKDRHIPSLDTRSQGDIAIICIGPWNMFLTSAGKLGLVL